MKPSLDKVHPAAALFPLMEGRPFDELVADIAEHGQREPVYVLPDGLLIDGRNRVHACDVLGRTADTVLYLDDTSDDAVTRFVVSQNIHRRHLDETQLAFIGVEVEKVYAAAARKRQGTRTDLQPSGKSAVKFSEARDEAAADVGVSGRQIQKAKYVTKHGTVDLVAAARAGKLSLNKAETIARRPKPQQPALVHESVVEIPALKERRRQTLAAMTPAQRSAERERERHGADVANLRARCAGLLDRINAIAASRETRNDFAKLLPDGILAELDGAISACRKRLDQLQELDNGKRQAV